MVLFAEASLARGGLAGAWAKRQREATLMSPRPQARRVLQRFARLVQRSSLADAAAASGARATAEALADEACALAPAVLARGATLPGARVKSCSKQSGKLVLTLDATAGSSRSSSSSRRSVSSGNVAKSGSARNTPSPGRKVKSLAVGQCVKGTVTKGGEAVHLGPGLEATLLAEAHAPAEGSVVDVVVCSALAQKGAAGQTVRVALAGTEVAAAAVKQAAAAAAAAAAAEGHSEGISSSSAAAAAVAAQEEFAALLAASEVSASGNYDMGDEDDEDDEDKGDVDEEEAGEDDEDEDDLPMNISDL
jgi:hypothetical protein